MLQNEFSYHQYKNIYPIIVRLHHFEYQRHHKQRHRFQYQLNKIDLLCFLERYQYLNHQYCDESELCKN